MRDEITESMERITALRQDIEELEMIDDPSPEEESELNNYNRQCRRLEYVN